MRFTYKKFDYEIGFEYFNRLESDKNPHYTACRIRRGPIGVHPKEMKEAFYNVAIRAPNDPFIKEVGRKISLTRALSISNKLTKNKPSKAFRTAVWTAYWMRS